MVFYSTFNRWNLVTFSLFFATQYRSAPVDTIYKKEENEIPAGSTVYNRLNVKGGENESIPGRSNKAKDRIFAMKMFKRLLAFLIVVMPRKIDLI